MVECPPRTRCSRQIPGSERSLFGSLRQVISSVLVVSVWSLLTLFVQSSEAQQPTGPALPADLSSPAQTSSIPSRPSAADPTTGSTTSDNDTAGAKKTKVPPTPGALIGLLSGSGLALILFVALLHLWDSKKAYQYSAQARDELASKLPDKLSADEFARVADTLTKSPDGIPGTTRSIVTYSLVLVLAFGIFYLLTMPVDGSVNDTAGKLLTLLSGALTSVIGFYFGTKAAADGVAAQTTPKAQPKATPATRIDSVQPPKAKSGDIVVIRGVGFGPQKGNVEFGKVSVASADIRDWSEETVTLTVPDRLETGPVDVTLNPATGNKVVGHGLFEII